MELNVEICRSALKHAEFDYVILIIKYQDDFAYTSRIIWNTNVLFNYI